MNMLETVKLLLEQFKRVFEYPLFSLSSTEFTAGSIIVFLLSLFLLLYLSKVFKTFLIKKVLIRYNEDIGVRQAMGTIARYIIVVLGLFIIIQANGIDLSGLAIIGGALGVGIGFGLQSITNNFVSGIVILLERPIKIGDRIEVGDTTGDVTKISARATTVMTNDGISVIIPNSEFIASRVINWSYSGRIVRFKVPLPAPYGVDKDKVIKLLLEVATEDENVRSEPPPHVRLKEFADSALTFELVFWTSTLMHRQGMMKSRIRLAVYQKFADNNITIPFPQMDLHVKEQPQK
jgi:small-conductance mechanosensitive channel